MNRIERMKELSLLRYETNKSILKSNKMKPTDRQTRLQQEEGKAQTQPQTSKTTKAKATKLKPKDKK